MNDSTNENMTTPIQPDRIEYAHKPYTSWRIHWKKPDGLEDEFRGKWSTTNGTEASVHTFNFEHSASDFEVMQMYVHNGGAVSFTVMYPLHIWLDLAERVVTFEFAEDPSLIDK